MGKHEYNERELAIIKVLESRGLDMMTPHIASRIIQDQMALGISRDGVPGLLDMTEEEFLEFEECSDTIREAMALGDQKMKYYFDQLAVEMAKSNATVLMALLRDRLGLDLKDDKSGGTVIVEVKKFLEKAEGKKNPNPK